MTEIEKERVLIFRRILGNSEKEFSKKISSFSDEELLEILNHSIYPNSLSISAIKYTIFSAMILNKKNIKKEILKIDKVTDVLTSLEKDMFKFGLFYGYTNLNHEYQYSRFIKHSVNPEIGSNIFKKKIPLNIFKQTFEFIYKIIKRGDNNERFPRI